MTELTTIIVGRFVSALNPSMVSRKPSVSLASRRWSTFHPYDSKRFATSSLKDRSVCPSMLIVLES